MPSAFRARTCSSYNVSEKVTETDVFVVYPSIQFMAPGVRYW